MYWVGWASWRARGLTSGGQWTGEQCLKIELTNEYDYT